MHIDTTVDAAIQTADLVVEAVVENMELKQKLFAEYDDKVIKHSYSKTAVFSSRSIYTF